MLGEKDRKTLLQLARNSVQAAVRDEPVPDGVVGSRALQDARGAFVTLKTSGRLRGCLGRFVADDPLWKTVRDMAVAAAREDPRFVADRITPPELDELQIEISVLSPLKKTEDPIEEMELGKHGIYIRRGERTGCFLPQVALEAGWNKELFLDNCCSHKAGLPPGVWRDDPATEVYLFTAEVIRSRP